MKLRAKLIIAFVALSVLPLAGVTLYSYLASIHALRQAVEAEARASTGEMGQRLEEVTADLGQRIDRLESLPADVFLADRAAPAGPVDDDETAQPFLATLEAAMGDAAAMLASLEFKPIAQQHATHAQGADDPSDTGPIVIHLNRVLSAADEGLVDLETTRFLRAGRDLMVLPGRITSAGEDPEALGRVLAETLVTLREHGGEALGEALDVITAQALEEVREVEVASGVQIQGLGDAVRILIESKEVRQEPLERERRGAAAPDADATREAAQRIALVVEKTTARVASAFDEQPAPPVPPAPPAANPPTTAPAAWTRLPSLGREFSTPLLQDGQTVGHLLARIDSEEVLRSVLARSRREQGEIPFAVAADGTLYTADATSRAALADLEGTILGTGPPAAGVATSDDWVVVTRQVPGTDVTFGIARPVGASMRELRRTAGRNMAWGLGLVALAMLGIVPLSGHMTRDLSTLSAGAAALGRGDLDTRVPIRSRDEIGDLARVFNQMGASLQEQRSQLVTQERLRKELELCRQLQDTMLPSGSGSLALAELRAVSIPAREVGGDFFNYFELEDGSVALVIGDVSGKGVPAALLMANLQATLRARLPISRDLATLAETLDTEIEATTPARTYVTLFVGVLDARGRTLRYVNAGHNPQYLARTDGSLERLVSSGRPVGLLSGGRFHEREVPVAPGDAIFLYTDGLVESENAAGEAWGEDRLEALLAATRDRDADGLLADVERSVQAHRGGVDAPDDATVLVLRVR